MSQRHISSSFPKKKGISQQRKGHGKGKGKGKASQSLSKTSTASSSATFDPEKDVLRKFDLNSEYGPCLGITRLERWERAQHYGLDPPQKVLEIISRHSEDKDYTENLWYDYSTLS